MGASPFRTAINGLKYAFEVLPELNTYEAPSYTTAKRWVQKVGYFKLTRSKVIANDWMVIIDASIQIGPQKCLLVLGCRKVDLPPNKTLTLENCEILALRVISNLNSESVTQILNEVKLSVGSIMSICSDRGSDMLRGIKNFQINNPKTRHIDDTAHRVANLLEAALEKNESWKSFRKQVTQARRKMQNSLVAGALPPSPRTKARFMNVDSLIQWAIDMLLLLDHGITTEELDINELKKYLDWLQNFKTDLQHWHKLTALGQIARQMVRIEGIHLNSVNHFKQAVAPLNLSTRELYFFDKICLFLSQQSKALKLGDQLLGSTEVLESLFGKLKFMEREQTAFGFTSLVLAAVACVGPTDDKTIEDAIRAVQLSDIEDWAKKEIGESIQSKRRSVRKIIKNLKAKMGQDLSGILEGEKEAA